MRLIYGYDFETTGFPLWSKPSSDPGQPHIVQCAAVLVDADTREIVSSFDLIARPEDWTIPDDVAEIHGITTEYASEVGVLEERIVGNLFAFHKIASLRVGHNQPFDARIMRIAMKRFDREPLADSWKEGESYCTQKHSTPIVKCPPSAKMLAAGRKGNKTANLGEAYEHFTGKKLEGAHTAMADTLACMEVYWGIQDLECAANPGSRNKVPDVPDEQGPGGDGVGFL